MTLQNLVESVEQAFPQLGRTQIIKEFDLAQKSLCTEIGLIEESGSLSDVDSYISWNLPTGFVELNELDFYDTNGDPLYIENLDLDFEIYDGQIHFFSTTTTPLDSIPSTVAYIVLRYKRLPSDLESITSTVEIDEVEYPAMEALVFKRLFSKIPVPRAIDNEGKIVSMIDRSSVNYWDKEYYRLKVEAKKRNNSLDSTKRSATYYNHAGLNYFVRRTKEVSIDTIDIPSYSTLYSKYVRFTAVAPGTFTEVFRYGYGDLSYSMDGNDIVITSSGEFDEETWGDDIQNSAHQYVSANEFRFTPSPSLNWGTTMIEIWKY